MPAEGGGLIGASSTVTNVARTGGIDKRWLGIAGVLLAAVIGWSVWSGSSNEPIADNASEAGTTTVPSATPSSTSSPDAPSGSSPSSTVEESVGEPVIRVVGAGKPLLGESTGFRLIMNSQTNGPLVLDLDTGELRSAPGVGTSLEPVAVVGDRLIGRRFGQMVSLPLDDIDAEPVALSGNASYRAIDLASPRTDDLVWLSNFSDGTGSAVLVDPADGSVVETTVEDERFSALHRSMSYAFGEPDLVTSAAGGVYERRGDEFTKVADGSLIVADEFRALVLVCNDSLECRTQWFDRESWLLIGISAPEGSFIDASFVNRTNWLVVVGNEADDFRVRLHDVELGTEIELERTMVTRFLDSGPTISPDGRWLAWTLGGKLFVLDLDNGTETEIEGITGLTGSLVFTSQEVGYGAVDNDGSNP